MPDIPKTMRAVVYRGVNDLRLETVPVPQIGANELLVRVAVCGVCPTDIKKIQHGLVPPPRIFGHETAGTIVKIGASGSKTQNSKLKIQNLKVGDRVALHHHVPCGRCHFCRHRAFAQCAAYKRTGITAGFEPAGGGYAEYVRVLPFVLPGVVKIPAANSFAEGAMLEPVNTILKAVKRLNLLPGDTALVAGQGPIGLMFTKILQLARVRVLATDLLESRLKLAKKFGAKWTKLVSSPQSSVHSRGNRVSGLTTVDCGLATLDCGLATLDCGLATLDCGLATLDCGLATLDCGLATLDCAVIAVPSDAAVQQALQLVRGGGQVLLFAHTKRNSKSTAPSPQVSPCDSRAGKAAVDCGLPTVDFSSICLDEKDLIGSYSSDFTLQAEVARLVFSRRLDVRPLITNSFPLEQTADAVALASHPTAGSLKILVHTEI